MFWHFEFSINGYFSELAPLIKWEWKRQRDPQKTRSTQPYQTVHVVPTNWAQKYHLISSHLISSTKFEKIVTSFCSGDICGANDAITKNLRPKELSNSNELCCRKSIASRNRSISLTRLRSLPAALSCYVMLCFVFHFLSFPFLPFMFSFGGAAKYNSTDHMQQSKWIGYAPSYYYTDWVYAC